MRKKKNQCMTRWKKWSTEEGEAVQKSWSFRFSTFRDRCHDKNRKPKTENLKSDFLISLLVSNMFSYLCLRCCFSPLFCSSQQTTSMSFGDDYYSSLQALTFNSRPIIESHTTLAQENTQFASDIVNAIEKRIEKAIPSQKLFCLYLLDSISKNIGLPYTSLFSNNLFKTFTQTYGLVDDQTRCKLIKLFKTWKIPTALTGLPLFDSNQLDKIEQFLLKVTAASNPGMNITPSSTATNQNSPINQRNTLVKEIDNLIVLVDSRLKSSVNDEKGQQRSQLLNQLKKILNGKARIDQPQLDAVSKQLQTIRDDELLKFNILKQQQIQQQQQQQKQQQQQSTQFNASQLQSLLSLSNGNNNQSTNNSAQSMFNMMGSVMNHDQQPQSQQIQINPSMDQGHSNPLRLKSLSFLENILKRSNNGNLNQATDNTAGKVDFKFIKPTKKSIIEDATLTQSFINNHTPNKNEISLLYEFKPVICPSCPKRFSDSEEGLMLFRKHEEWHERVEQRLKVGGNGLGGVVNRSWYLRNDEWFEFNDDTQMVDKSNNDTNPTDAAVNVVAKTAVIMDSDKSKSDKDADSFRDRTEKIDLNDAQKHIVHIPESSNNEVMCGICKDMIIGIFDEENGDWIWKNAIEQKGRIWHWSCWMEAKARSRRDRSPTR